MNRSGGHYGRQETQGNPLRTLGNGKRVPCVSWRFMSGRPSGQKESKGDPLERSQTVVFFLHRFFIHNLKGFNATLKHPISLKHLHHPHLGEL